MVSHAGGGGGGGYHSDWTPLDIVVGEWQQMAARVLSAKQSLDEVARHIGDNFGWSATTISAYEYEQGRAEMARPR
jgi:hypothetical protein